MDHFVDSFAALLPFSAVRVFLLQKPLRIVESGGLSTTNIPIFRLVNFITIHSEKISQYIIVSWVFVVVFCVHKWVYGFLLMLISGTYIQASKQCLVWAGENMTATAAANKFMGLNVLFSVYYVLIFFFYFLFFWLSELVWVPFFLFV